MSASEGPVLIAYDGSPAAQHAVAAAAKLLAPRKVTVVTVWEEGLAYASAPLMPDGGTTLSIVDPDTAREVDHAEHGQAERVSQEGAELARSLGLNATPLAIPDDGSIGGTIVDLAREQRAQAIVIGSRGLTGLRARLEGSTSKAVTKHAACPVVVVHDDEEHEAGRG